MLAGAALSFFLFQATDAASGAAPYSAMHNSPRFDACLAAIETDAEAAYESAMAWANEGNELPAFHCAAMALIEMGRIEQGARRLESLAMAAEGYDAGTQAALLSQAGHSWMLAGDPARARSAFTRVIAALGSGSPGLPDALIDRSLAYSMEDNPRLAEEDLSRSLDLRPNDPTALRLRAMARMEQNALDLALADAEASMRLDPTSVDSALVLGHVREARRVGHPIDPSGAEPEPTATE